MGAADDSEHRPTCVLLIGVGRLADATDRALRAGGAGVRRLEEPTDPEIRDALDDRVDRVVVISRYDHVSLRLALVVAHVKPGMPTLVTIFDRDAAAHVRRTIEDATVVSMAEIVAPALVGPCLDPELLSLVHASGRAEGIRAIDGEPQLVGRVWDTPGRLQRARAALEGVFRPFDPSARILVAGLLGVLGVLAVETIVTMIASGLGFVDALYSVAKVTVTVGPSTAAEQGREWFKLFSTVAMLLTLGFAAVLTAGLVNRLLDPRLTAIVGPAAVPRRDHVVVVGMGQVGLRLCSLLRELSIPVVAVEINSNAKNVTRAKDLRLPVVIGSGSSQRALRRLSIQNARGLAAVTSDEVENIAVAMAGLGVRDDLNVTLRAGDGDEESETASLFGIGVVRDIYRIAGATLAAVTLGSDGREAFPYEKTMYLVDEDGEIEAFEAPAATEDVPT